MKILKLMILVMLAFSISGVVEAAQAQGQQRRRMTREEYRQYLERLKQRRRQQLDQNKVKGVYKTYRPTATPTPRGAKPKKSDGTVVSLHKPSFSVALKGGLSLPMGESADFNEGGGGGQIDIYFHGASNLSVDAFFNYSSTPYKSGAVPDPLTAMGGGVRAIYHPLKMKQMTPNIGAGLGYFSIGRAIQVQTGTEPLTGLPIFGTSTESVGGIGFTAIIGATYHVTPKLGITVDINVYSVSLEGGTSDAILYGLAAAGVQYYF